MKLTAEIIQNAKQKVIEHIMFRYRCQSNTHTRDFVTVMPTQTEVGSRCGYLSIDGDRHEQIADPCIVFQTMYRHGGNVTILETTFYNFD